MVLGISLEGVLITIPLLLLALYCYATSTFHYWKKKGVFYLEPTPLFGNMKERMLFQKSSHEFQRDLYRKFEGHKYGGLFEGRRPLLMVRDPEFLRLILVRDFDHFVDRISQLLGNSPYIQNSLMNIKGQHWRNVRALMTPAFSSGKLKAMRHLVEQCGQQMNTFFRDQTSANGNNCIEVEMKELFGRFTLDVIAICAFGVQCDSLKDPEAEFVKTAARFNDISVLQQLLNFFVILLVPQFQHFFPINFLNKEVIDFLVDVVKKTKEYRMKNKDQKWSDFLQLMIDAAEGELASENGGNEVTTSKPSNTVLNEETVVAQSLLFLLAGFETSSTLLTFTCYELALNQDIQQKVRNEIEQVLDKHGGKCSYEALLEMTFLEMVLLESLRKHPPIAKVHRICTQPYTIPGTNVEINSEVVVTIPIMGLHHDSQYYPNPEVFDPDRFLPENKNIRPPYVFLPFGSGPRNCIGMRFAIMSSKIAMVHLIKDFCLRPTAKTKVPFKYNRFAMFLKAEGGIWLNIEKI